jgi:two-component system CheB/CheR fusion protein
MADQEDGPFVVGIGSSAGGIEALEALFRPMPADIGAAFVVVTHLAPGKISLLDEIVARFTPMPVTVAADGVRVTPGQVYVAPPDSTLTIEGGRLRLHATPSGERSFNPIDLFLGSLARDRGDHAIGVLLSGGGSDGTLGFKAIKEAGGLNVAQGSNHGVPRHASMPDSAIVAGVVDVVAPVEEIAGKLRAYLDSFQATRCPEM